LAIEVYSFWIVGGDFFWRRRALNGGEIVEKVVFMHLEWLHQAS
jgi:hypothetical protein